MKPELLTIGRLCLCAADVLMLYSFLHSMFERRVRRYRCFVYSAIVALMILVINTFANTVMNLLSTPLLLMFFSIASFRISLSNGVVYTLIYYILFAGGREAVFELLYRLISMVSPFQIAPWFTPSAMPYLIMEYILSFLYLLFIERFTSKLEANRNNSFCWYLLIMPLTTLLILIGYIYMDFPKSNVLAFIMCGGVFFLYFSNAAIFIVLEKYTEAMNQVRMAQLFDLKREMEKTNYESIDKANSVYRKYLHDMHQYFNQFRNLAMKGENHVIVSIIDELEGKLRIEESNIIYSRDTVLNVLFAEYCGRGKELGISMKVFVEEGLSLSFISDGDKISLFGNLLSNALEAAEQCTENKRSIDVELYMGNSHFLVFQVKNTHIMKAYKEGDHFMTTKKDAKNHGIGIKIVEKLAEKYGGTLELEMDENFFIATLMISTYQE